MGLHPLACILALFCLHLGCRTLVSSVLASYVYIQQTRKQTSRQAKKQIEGKHAKRQASEICQTGANKHMKHMKGQTTCYQTKGGVLGGQM